MIDPSYLPRKHVRLSSFVEGLKKNFALSFDQSSLRGLAGTQDTSTEQLMEYLLTRDEDWNFQNGMLQYDQPPRSSTAISQLKISDEAITASVVGSTSEADWVAQRCAELLWEAAGGAKPWDQIKKHAQMRSCQTSTRVVLGINLLDFFGPSFQEFAKSKITSEDGFAASMGRRPLDTTLLGAEPSNQVFVLHVDRIALRICLFNQKTGRSEECRLRFDVQARHEMGQGIIVVTSELDSETHTQMIQELRNVLQVAR